MNFKLSIIAIALMVMASAGYAQGLAGKLKQKAQQAAERALEKKNKSNQSYPEKKNESDQNDGTNDDSSVNKHPTNKGGAGLVTAPPDVKQNLSDAESAFKSSNYGEARYAAQQAMLGVEMEIGNMVLKSLPETVLDLPKEPEADKVTSIGWGWAGLTIQREYLKEEKQLRTIIANNSVWMSSLNMYLANAGYGQQTNGEQNWKQVKVKGHRAVIEYDESSGYKLSVPLGQSSLIVWEGVNFETEQEMMDAANAFDIDGIKKMLGEQ